MYDDPKHWFEFCDYIHIHDVDDKFLICTSYDFVGRFNHHKLYNWSNLMKETHKRYPNLMLHVETITTEIFLESVMNKTFNSKEFEKEYDCHINYMIPVTSYAKHSITKRDFNKMLPGFFPSVKHF